jgi:hypothetical protein
MSALSTAYNKSTILELVANNEPISFYIINIFLDECYASNDIESVMLLVNSSQVFCLFMDNNIFYSYSDEIHNIMYKITMFNNINMIDIIMHHANEYIDNEKQHYVGCHFAAYLYKYNFDKTAEEIINKYYLNEEEIIRIYKIEDDFNYIIDTLAIRNIN